MKKVQVLFVDDEERLLSALRRMLRDQRDVWDMYFVNSAKAALALMQSQHIDVIVSDMRMPEMDGAELLSIVQREHPHATRIILSGYAENETIFKTVGPSHRYLAKPCKSRVLRATIERALALRAILGGEELKKLVSGIKNIPSPSSAFRKFIAEVTSPRTTSERIAAALGADIALTAQTLKLTNSAYFALPQKVTSIEQAVRLLGLDTLRSLVTMATFYATYQGDGSHTKVLETLNARSMQIARLARNICTALKAPAETADAAFCAGLTAHIGTLILVVNLPGKFDEAVALVENGTCSIVEAEQRVFGATHAELGAYLLGLWGFQDSIVEAVAHHHQPPVEAEETVTPAMALHIAQFVSRAASQGGLDSEPLIRSALDSRTLEAMGGAEMLETWQRMYQEVCRG